MKKIKNWFMSTDNSNRYLAPEMRERVICGEIDGENVMIRKISHTEGRVIHLKNGDKYVLGQIEAGYRKYISDNGWSYDPKNPVKIVSKYTLFEKQ